MLPPSLSALPPDLLAHVLKFTTGSLRRDEHQPPATPLATWRYSLVSQSFRTAYISQLTSLSLSTSSCADLARQNWLPLSPCKSLRHLVITPDSGLMDVDVVNLFNSLKTWGIRIRHLDISVGRGVTQASILCFATVFGGSVVRLDVRVPWVRRVRRRRDWSHMESIFGADVEPDPIDQAEMAAAALGGDVLIHWFANPHLPNFVPNLNNDPAAPVVPANLHPQVPWMLIGDGEVHFPEFPPNFGDGGGEPVPDADMLAEPVIEPPEAFEEGAAVAANPGAEPGPLAGMMTGWHALQTCMGNDVFATVMSRLTGLKELVIDRARHINNTGILALSQCALLEKLVLYSNHSINDVALKSVLAEMSKLKVLRLRDMVLVGNGTVEAVCNGPGKSRLQFLELTRIGRVTDPGIRRVVNACDNLSTVHIVDCARITCVTASHLSCSLKLQHVVFKPQPRYPISNLTPVHLSCAASTLTSLQLVGCKNLSLDGIVALANLPGLRKLHLSGLGHISQDVMRSLGHFPRLDDLTLHGAMHLTDLGVKLLIGQRGHRFLHLALLDSTLNLTDDALDCISTWCGSLRTLHIHGMFGGGFEKLCEAIPSVSIRIQMVGGVVKTREGRGGVWDPVQRELETI